MKPIFPLLSLILLSGMAFAQYSSPPLGLLIGNNTAAAAALEGYYNSSYAQNGSVTMRFGSYSQNIPISASIIPMGLFPGADNMSCYSPDLAFVVARGSNAGMLTSVHAEGYPDFYCDRIWYDDPGRQFEIRCDFDDDSCVEYVNRSSVRYDVNVTFSFRNVTESVPLSSTLIAIPASVLAELESASGAENLTIGIEGNVTFIYEVNNRTDDGGCRDNSTNISASVPVSANSSFTVGGREKLFFQSAPILREQWFRNNHFDIIVLSQCPLYRAEMRINNASVKNITIRTFNLTTDGFGFMRMTSNITDSNGNGWMEDSSAVATPTPLEMQNNSFAYAYMFNLSYQGLGENNLSIMAVDSVLGTGEYNDTLLSRTLSHGGSMAETGQPIDANSRPSASFSEGSLTRLEIGLGLVGLVLILAFLNFWVAR